MNDRSAFITIDETEYELILTTRATKEIGKKYGGLSNLGEKLMKEDNLELMLEEVCWLISLLANQGIELYNYRNPADKKPLLTAELVELLTVPHDLASYKDAISAAMVKGTKRNIVSEEDPKNAQVG